MNDFYTEVIVITIADEGGVVFIFDVKDCAIEFGRQLKNINHYCNLNNYLTTGNNATVGANIPIMNSNVLDSIKTEFPITKRFYILA